MSTSTFVNSYAITVTHVTAKILLTLKEIIRDIGLDPSKAAKDWETYEGGSVNLDRKRSLQANYAGGLPPMVPTDWSGVGTWT